VTKAPDKQTAQAELSAGMAARNRGDLAAAAARFAGAVAADPRVLIARTALASTLIALGRHTEAVPHVEAALSIDAADGAALHSLGLLFLERALLGPAADAFERSIAADPARIDAWRNLALAQRSLGRPLEARRTIERGLERWPSDPGLLASLAALCELAGEHERVLEILEARVAAGDCAAEDLLILTRSLQALGRSAQARRLLESARVPARDRYRIEFALGELLDREGDHEAAFAHVQRANAGKHARFDPDGYRRHVDAIMDGFRALRASGTLVAGSDSQRPVFIVGMPRSGTSLIEQILAAHPDVAGAGELANIPLLAQTGAGARPGGMLALSAADAASRAGAYLQELERVDAGAARVTDKLWENFEYLGFIEQLFPRARVVHCTRDPRDIAVSCFFQHFAGEHGAAFAYDLGHIGAYYREYRRLMGFWAGESSLATLEVPYESVIGDLEAQARRLIEFLGLPWSPRCLEFHATKRIVNTASYAQVRRPLYATSVGRWRHYERHLGVFIEAAGL
jgi:tetratricopeptide (TPR) repeat protein